MTGARFETLEQTGPTRGLNAERPERELALAPRFVSCNDVGLPSYVEHLANFMGPASVGPFYLAAPAVKRGWDAFASRSISTTGNRCSTECCASA
jgi:hypothetical protein